MACHRLFAPRVGISFVGCPSQTHQEFKHDSDINAIVCKFLRTGQINAPNADRPLVDGFEAIGDFTESCNRFFDEVNHVEVGSSGVEDNQGTGTDDSGAPSGSGDHHGDTVPKAEPDKQGV